MVGQQQGITRQSLDQSGLRQAEPGGEFNFALLMTVHTERTSLK